jgi:hypothetical protein
MQPGTHLPSSLFVASQFRVCEKAVNAMVHERYMRFSQLAAREGSFRDVKPLISGTHICLHPPCVTEYESFSSSIGGSLQNIHQELFDFSVTYGKKNNLYISEYHRRNLVGVA